jgi:hypothetical protein
VIIMNTVAQKETQTKKRRWLHVAVGVASGILLGAPVGLYYGIRWFASIAFGFKLPAISSDVKRGLAIGLAVAVSALGTIFSGGFAAPTVPAIIAGALTCTAGVAGTIIVDKRSEEQQSVIQDLKVQVEQLNTQQQRQNMQQPSITKQSTQTQTVSNNEQPIPKQVPSKKTLTSNNSKNAKPRPKLKFKARPKRTNTISEIVSLETRNSRVGTTADDLSPDSVQTSKAIKRSKGDPEK